MYNTIGIFQRNQLIKNLQLKNQLKTENKINYKYSMMLRNPLPAYTTISKTQKNQLRSTVDFKYRKMNIHK